MTLDEFEEFTLAVLALAGAETEAHRVQLVDRMLREYVVRMPSELAAYKEAVQQQQHLTEAVTLAAKMGKLQSHLTHGEPS